MSEEVGSVRFTDSRGTALYVFADHVVAVHKGHTVGPGECVISFASGFTLQVKGEPEEVSRRIDGARSYG